MLLPSVVVSRCSACSIVRILFSLPGVHELALPGYYLRIGICNFK